MLLENSSLKTDFVFSLVLSLPLVLKSKGEKSIELFLAWNFFCYLLFEATDIIWKGLNNKEGLYDNF